MNYFLQSNGYQLNSSDYFLSGVMLSGAAYANRHWELSNQNPNDCLGHRFIACIEYIPVLGAIVAIIERVVFAIFEQFFKKENHQESQEFGRVLPRVTRLTMQACQIMDSTELLSRFDQIAIEINKLFQESLSLKFKDTSMQYSLCVSQAEKQLEMLELLAKVFNQRDTLEPLDVKSHQQRVQKMYDDAPLGESVPLKGDVRLLQSLSELPTEKTYTNEYGSFYNLNTSLSELSNWFAPFATQGAYKGVMCSFTNNYIISTINLNRMFTLIALDKKEDQKQIEEERYAAYREHQPSTVDAIWRNVKRSSWQALETFLDVPPVDYQSIQKKALTSLRDQLPIMINQWKFESFEILTTEELLKQGYPLNFALVGDCILLFHKRVQNNDHIVELDD